MPDQFNNPSRQPQKFFDVVMPGGSAPSASSKPIIPSGRPLQPDPMMSPARPPQPDMVTTPVTTPSAPIPFTPIVSAPEPSTVAAAPLEQPIVEKHSKVKSAHHRMKIMLPLIVGLVVIFAAIDLLVDANIIHTSVTPLTNFFHHH